jgi:hypothetical protein
MCSRPPLKLSLLRDIGWSRWDPLGLNGSWGGWQHSNAADEYDRYMVHVAGGLQSGEPDRVLVDYLVTIETRHMGLPDSLEARTRAEGTVAAIRDHI